MGEKEFVQTREDKYTHVHVVLNSPLPDETEPSSAGEQLGKG